MLCLKNLNKLWSIPDVLKARVTAGLFSTPTLEDWVLPFFWRPSLPFNLDILFIQRATAVVDFLIMVGVVVKIALGGGDILIAQ